MRAFNLEESVFVDDSSGVPRARRSRGNNAELALMPFKVTGKSDTRVSTATLERVAHQGSPVVW